MHVTYDQTQYYILFTETFETDRVQRSFVDLRMKKCNYGKKKDRIRLLLLCNIVCDHTE